MQEGIAIGRSFGMTKNYQIDGNKEMIAFGLMNVVGSFTSCYLTTGTILKLTFAHKYCLKSGLICNNRFFTCEKALNIERISNAISLHFVKRKNHDSKAVE